MTRFDEVEEEELAELRQKIEHLEYLEARYGELDDEYDESPSFVRVNHPTKDKPKGKPREKQRRVVNEHLENG
jgi:hypothetical protein